MAKDSPTPITPQGGNKHTALVAADRNRSLINAMHHWRHRRRRDWYARAARAIVVFGVCGAAPAAFGADAPNPPHAPSEPSEPDTAIESGDAEQQWLPGEISAEVGLVSDYVDRGITNTDHNPAIQGGLSYSVDVGLPDAQPYVGFWGSNVDFDDGGEAHLELDLMFGFSGTTAGIDWDIGAVYYWYPGANSDLNYNYWEVPLLLSYELDYGFSLLGEYYYSPDFFGGSGQAHYLLGGLRWEYPIRGITLGIEGATGHQWIDDNETFGAQDYQDWRIAVSVTMEPITLGLAYTDTNLDKNDCFGGTNQCEPRAVLSLTAAF